MQSPVNHRNKREKCCAVPFPKKIQEWDRTIPKANYVTLGSLRFGVKPVPRESSQCSTEEGSRDTDASILASENSENKCFDPIDCCCIGASNALGDGQTIYRKESRLPVSVSNAVAKNRTLSSSSSSTSTTPRSSTFKRCLVIENHNQVRSTCCYPNSLKNRTISPESSKRNHLNSQVHYKVTKNCENLPSNGALFNDNENGERSNNVRKSNFCENVNRIDENSYTSLLLLTPSSFQRENSLIHSSSGTRSINSVIDSSAIFNQHYSYDQINRELIQNTCNKRENYPIHSTCNDPDLIQSNQDNVNDVWNVDSVGVSKLRTPSNLCKSNRRVPIIRKLTPKVKTKILSLNEGFECNVIVEQQHRTKIAQLSAIKQDDNVKSNDGTDDDDSHFILYSNSTADVGCLSSTPCNDAVFVCDDDRANASECLVKNAENQFVFVEEGKYLNSDDRFYKQNFRQRNCWKELNGRSNENDENNLRKSFNSEGLLKEQYQYHYKKISLQENQQLGNTSETASLLFLGSNRQCSGIYSNMEKGRNTLDRWQRLRFGRRSTNTSTEKVEKEKTSKGSEKTERLRELTELLRGSRPSSTSVPPPIPPPRKQKSIGSQNQDNSSTSSSVKDLTDSHALDSTSESNVYDTVDKPHQQQLNKPITIIKSLRPNTSACQLEYYDASSDKLSKSPPLAEKEDDLFTALPKVESRTIVGSYTQKNIPFRSASFSQVDYSSGKYIRSAIGAFKATLKSNKEPSVIENTNLTLPRKKDRFSPTKIDDEKTQIEIDSTSNQIAKTQANFQAAHKLHESPDGRLESRFHRESLIEENENEVDDSMGSLNILNAEQMIIESPSERGILMATPPQEEYLQTATTCLIPLPVYECANRESEPNDQWINACDEDSTKLFEELNVESNVISEIKCGRLESDNKQTSCGAEIDNRTEIAIPDSIIQSEEIEVISNEIEIVSETTKSLSYPTITEINEIASNEVDEPAIIPRTIKIKTESIEIQAQDVTSECVEIPEFVEVRKRYNNDEKVTRQSDNLSNSSESLNSVATGEDRRRSDKTKRRKGIYFQWPAIEKDKELDIDVWSSQADSSPTILTGSIIWDGTIDNGSGVTVHNKTDLKEIECNLDNPKTNNRSNKISVDLETPNFFSAAFESTTPESEISRPAWPKIPRKQNSDERDDSSVVSSTSDKQHHKISFLRQDSISDNETDRTPPHERVSQSPSSNEQDLKRYSKRPLRGPYGQMLEAEMKKPAKLLYDEPFNRSESASKLSDSSLQSFSDDVQRKSYRKNNNTHLPIPYHVRASSTPIQSESYSKEVSHKRFPSYVDTSTINDLKKDQKKMSLDNINMTKSQDNFGKECKKYSVGSEKIQKHSLDEGRLMMSSDNSDKKKYISDTSNTIQATPQLLAQLLKGSSERLVSEQLQSNQRITSSSLPTAVLKCLRNSFIESSTNIQTKIYGSMFRFTKSFRVGWKSWKRTQRFSLSKWRLNKMFSNTYNMRHSNIKNILSAREISSALDDQIMPSSDACSDSEEEAIKETKVCKWISEFEDDTRTHVVVELYHTEKSYVESLETVVVKYLNPLKSSEHTGIIDIHTVEEIFLMVPTILKVHKHFLDELERRLDSWKPQQMVGDVFIETFSKPTVLDAYTLFVNNCNRAKDAIRLTSSTRPAFSRFLEAMAREHKGKLSLDNLLIKPIQKFPNYELILSRLVKHTNTEHPDQKPLQEAIHLVHSILLHLNCKEREALENNQRETLLRDLESIIEGASDLVINERQFISFDLVSIPSGQVGRKERGLFLFSDLLIITSIKRRTGTMRKPNSCPGSVASTLDTNKYKLLMKMSVDDAEVVKAKDENVEKARKEIDNLTKDFSKLAQIIDIASSLRCPNHQLEEIVRDLQKDIQRQLSDRQTNDTQLNILELMLKTTDGIQNMSIIFSKPDKRTQWEQAFNEAKQKLVSSMEKHPVPEFVSSTAIRKTRAGLQFTCAVSTLGDKKDVWICNSDGYVGQVCILSFKPGPEVVSCNGVCNARILCVASIPASIESSISDTSVSISIEDTSVRQSTACSTKSDKKSDKCSDNIQLDSSSSSDSENDLQEKHAPPTILQSDQTQTEKDQATMWLGTEDGCIHVYNCSDNIRIKKHKTRLTHVTAVYCILYMDNRVFLSLANGLLVMYYRDGTEWTDKPIEILIGTVTSPATKIINVHGKIWSAIQGDINIINSYMLLVDNIIKVSTDSKPITNMEYSTNHVWISVLNSSNIKCYHSISYDPIYEINLAPQVNKMLLNCDDIIRQHKAACLRVTSMLACKEMIWVGTSAGVLLTISAIPTSSGIEPPIVTGIPQGHTGHVRIITCLENKRTKLDESKIIPNRQSLPIKTKPDSTNMLIISGGDGYEDFFRNTSAQPSNEVSGREDSTNHLLLWKV